MSSATYIVTVISLAVVILGIVYFLVERIDRRLESLEHAVTAGTVELGKIGQRLDDHITHHPGPTEQLVRP